MDCAPFIRTKWVLATWLTVPLLALVGAELAVRGFHNQQKAAFEQNKTLALMVPRMQEEASYTTRLLKTYRVDHAINGSAQDIYISLLKAAAEQSGLIVETIHLDQETLDYDLRTTQIVICLQGTGTCRQIAEFLKEIKLADPLICESELAMAPSGKAPGNLQINADFIKIYIDP